MNKKLLSSVMLLTLVAPALAGCGADEELKIKLKDFIVSPVRGEEYDFGDCIEQENNVSYSIEVYYQNYYEMKEYKLETDGLCFTPITSYDLSIIVTAKKGKKTATRRLNFDVDEKGDPIDELLSTNGWSGWSDPGFIKELNFDEQYLHSNNSNDPNSTTSLLINYSGSDGYPYGSTLLAMNNFRCLDYWTDKEWTDAVIVMWVFNPMEADIEFQLRIKDDLTGRVDIDWGNDANVSQIAKAGEWTQCLFPLRPMGINHTLYLNEAGNRTDSIVIKSRYLGVAASKQVPSYTYTFYADGIDVAPSSYFPGLDTRVPDRVESLVVNAWVDPGMSRKANYDNKDMILDGESSLHYSFSGENVYGSGCATLTLNDLHLQNDFTAKAEDYLEGAVLTWSVYNPNEKNIEFALRIKDTSQDVDFDWGDDRGINPILIAEPGKWTTFNFNLKDVDILAPVVKDGRKGDYELTVKSRYEGRKAAPYSFDMYIDKIDIVPASSITEVSEN